MGPLGRSGDGAPACSRRRGGAGRDRARLRDGVLLGLARAARRPAGRRSTSTPAQLETARALQAEFGLEFPLCSGKRRGRAASGRELRSRGLRVRRDASGAIPYAVDARGGEAPAPGGRARLPARNSARDPVLARTRGELEARASAAVLRHAPPRVGGRRDSRRVPPCATATGSACCGGAGSRSRTSSSSRRPDAGRSTGIYDCHDAPSGPGSGRRRRSG